MQEVHGRVGLVGRVDLEEGTVAEAGIPVAADLGCKGQVEEDLDCMDLDLAEARIPAQVAGMESGLAEDRNLAVEEDKVNDLEEGTGLGDPDCKEVEVSLRDELAWSHEDSSWDLTACGWASIVAALRWGV